MAGLLWVWPGCGPSGSATTQPGATTQTGATTRTAQGEGPSTRPAPAPLPEKATLKLADIKPVPAKPENKPYAKELPEQAVKVMNEAQQLLATGNNSGAIEKLERAVGYDPDHPKIRRMLGMAYAALPNRGKAIDNLRRAAKAQPDDLEVQVLLGEFSAGQNQFAQAITDFRTALLCSTAKPTETLAAYALLRQADLLEVSGYWSAALDSFTKLGNWVEQNGRSYSGNRALSDVVLHPQLLLRKRGELLMRLRRADEGVDLLDRAFHRDRSDLPTNRLLVEGLIQTRQFERGEKLIVDMAGESAQIGQTSQLAERICQAAGDRGMPMRIWKVYRARYPFEAPLAVAMASSAERLGAVDDALELVKGVLDKIPGHAVAGRMLAGLYARKGSPEDALRQLASLLAADPTGINAVNEGIAEVVAAGGPKDFEQTFANKVIAEKSDRKYALNYVAGRLAQVKGKRFIAIDQYRRALEAKADFLAVYEPMVEVYVAEFRFDEVDRLMAKLNKLAENDYFPSYLMGKIQLARGKPGEAVTALERARKRNPNHVPTLLLLGDAYARTGQADTAERTYREAVQLQNDDPECYRRLFDFYTGRRPPQHEQAGQVVLALLSRQPGGVQGRLMQAELLILTRQTDEARKVIQALQVQAPGNADVELLKLRLDLGDWSGLIPKKDFDGAVDRLSRIIAQNPQKVPAKRMLAELLSLPGKQVEAALVWRRLYEDTSHQSDVARDYTFALMRADQYVNALELLKGLLDDDPKDFLVRLRILQCLDKTRQYPQLIQYAEKWLAEKDEDPRPRFEYRLRLFKAYKDAKEYDKGQKFVDGWIADEPDGPVRALRAEKIRFYCLAGQYDRAIDYATKWHDEAPGDAERTDRRDAQDRTGPRRALLGALTKANQFDKGHAELDKWIAGNGTPDMKEFYRRLKIVLYSDANQTDPAEKYALDWIKQSPQSMAPRETLVGVLAKAQRYGYALKLVDDWLKQYAATFPSTQAARKSKNVKDLREEAVRLLLLDRKYPEALGRAEAYLKGDPNDAKILDLKATVLMELGRTDEALTVLERVHGLEPNTPTSCNNLGYYYADRGIKLDKAEEMVRLAVSYMPVTAYQDSLAWVFYKQGRLIQAGRIFDELLRPSSADLEEDEADDVNHPVILDHAGDVYYRLGWLDKAVELWTKAVEKARKDKQATREIRGVLTSAQEKLKAVKAGQEPKVAPLGQGVKEPGVK